MNTALNMFRNGKSYIYQIFGDKKKIDKIIRVVPTIKDNYNKLFLLFIKSGDISTFFEKTRELINNPILISKKFKAIYPLYVSYFGLLSFTQLCQFILYDILPDKSLLYNLLVLKELKVVKGEIVLSHKGIPCDCSRVILSEMLMLVCNYYPFFVDENADLISSTSFEFVDDVLPSIPVEIFDDKTSSLRKGIYSLIEICRKVNKKINPFENIKTLFFYNNLLMGDNELPLHLHFKGENEKIFSFALSSIGVASHYDVSSFNASHHFSMGIETTAIGDVFINVGNDAHSSSYLITSPPSPFCFSVIREELGITGSFPSIVVYNLIDF
jgi:hypothetical protein